MSKLLNIRCDNCGSEYRVSSRGEMNCRFCGSKVYLSDSDFKGFLKTRDEMLQKDKYNNGDPVFTNDKEDVFKRETSAFFDYLFFFIHNDYSLIY